VSVEINIPQFLHPITDEVKVVDVDGGTVGDCLSDLVKRFPRLEAKLFSENGKLQSYLGVYVNGESAYPDELARKVTNGDELHIINIIAGG
jgi:adenylyltransferase/sulfurtransferase